MQKQMYRNSKFFCTMIGGLSPPENAWNKHVVWCFWENTPSYEATRRLYHLRPSCFLVCYHLSISKTIKDHILPQNYSFFKGNLAYAYWMTSATTLLSHKLHHFLKSGTNYHTDHHTATCTTSRDVEKTGAI